MNRKLRLDKKVIVVLFFFFGLFLSGTVYWSGIVGSFLFDDYSNLSSLGQNGGIHSWSDAIRFIFGGAAGPTGRPLALASFLLDGQDWPTEAAPFKRTNILLHLLVGVVIFGLFRKLAQILQKENADLIALLGMVLFLWAPIQSSTVFLVIQRMTILFTFFSLLALWGYLIGWEYHHHGKIAQGRWWMSISLIVAGSLAFISKETALVLPLLVGVFCFTVTPLSDRLWKTFFIYLPTITIAIYFLQQLFYSHYELRDFTLSERLLSQPFILWDYFHKIIIPKVTIVLFYDDFRKITSPLDWRFLLSFCGWLLVIFLAINLRKKQPVLSFGILFFLAGHSLEAGPTPLELYFLHRNYLPMVGIIFAAAFYIGSHLSFRPLLLAAIGYLMICVGITFSSSTYWANSEKLSLAWAYEKPHSMRSVAMAANYLGIGGNYQKAYELLDALNAFKKQSPSIQFSRYYLKCLAKKEERKIWDEFIKDIPSHEYDFSITNTYDLLMLNVQSGECRAIQPSDVVDSIQALIQGNRRYQNPAIVASLRQRQALYMARFGLLDEALVALEQSIAAMPYEETLLQKVEIYRTQKNYPQAIATLNRTIAFDPRSPNERKLVSDEPRKARLRAEIKRIEALMQQAAPPPPSSPPHTPAP